MLHPAIICGWFLLSAALHGQTSYDLLLAGGHVIDPKNGINRRMDVAIAGGRIALLAAAIPSSQAAKVVRVDGLYVTPGLIDIHTHVFAGSGLKGSLPVEQNVWPDSHSLRCGVTTVVDAGATGWRNFPEFKRRILDHCGSGRGQIRTRVLAFLNIVGRGQAGDPFEQDTADMDAEAAAKTAKEFKQHIVGIKTAHYRGPEWVAVERAVQAGILAGIPVMVDFGAFRPERPYEQLVLKYLRPGDISTHMYGGSVPILDEGGKVRSYLFEARQRGVKFDTGHGGGSFTWKQAIPAVRQGWLPDSISTDLHTISMNAGMKDMTNVMSKFLNLGVPLFEVVKMATVNPALEIQRPELGHLSAGAPADVVVLRVDRGRFGFLDVNNARLTGDRLLVCELTLRDGQVVWDLNGRAGVDWQVFYRK